MIRKYHINIKYCGGCNPEIDRGSLIIRFKELLDKSPLKDKIIFDDGRDILIKINGCQHACLDENNTHSENYSNSISARGKMIELYTANENDLPEILLKKIERMIN